MVTTYSLRAVNDKFHKIITMITKGGNSLNYMFTILLRFRQAGKFTDAGGTILNHTANNPGIIRPLERNALNFLYTRFGKHVGYLFFRIRLAGRRA